MDSLYYSNSIKIGSTYIVREDKISAFRSSGKELPNSPNTLDSRTFLEMGDIFIILDKNKNFECEILINNTKLFIPYYRIVRYCEEIICDS